MKASDVKHPSAGDDDRRTAAEPDIHRDAADDDAVFERQMRVARELMDKWKAVLAALAKS